MLRLVIWCGISNQHPRQCGLDRRNGKVTYEEIDALRLKAFMTNGDADRKAYFDGASKWFQDEVFRRMDHTAELSNLRAENERLREALRDISNVDYLDHTILYAKEALK